MKYLRLLLSSQEVDILARVWRNLCGHRKDHLYRRLWA
jgi:hypothetical protein